MQYYKCHTNLKEKKVNLHKWEGSKIKAMGVVARGGG
jgi:hypothetical protein